MGLQPFEGTYPIFANISITPANGTNVVQASPACAVPHRWLYALAHSTAVADHDLLLDAYVGSVQFKLGTVTVPLGAGLTTVPAVEIFAALLPSTEQGIALTPSSVLRAALAVTLGAGETLTVALVGVAF